MSTVTPARPLEEAPFVNVFDPAVQADAQAVFAAMRETTALVRNPLGASVIRYEPVHRLLGDHRLASAIPHLIRLQGVTEGWLLDMLTASVIAADGPDHTRLRRLVSKSFTPRAAARHRPAMRQLVDELVDGFAAAGRCEFVTEFADRYPVQVICEVLGVPREDHPKFAAWGQALTHVLSLELSSHRDAIEEASHGLGDYVGRLVEERREEPRDDLVTSLVEVSEDGDRLSDLELFSMIGGLLFAGYDTTRNQLSLAMAVFAEHPEQWSLLAERPELAPQAVEEVMRLHGAIGGVPRIATEDIEVEGWSIPAGTMVFLSAASANRDAAVYGDEGFDITAARPTHLTFGGGPHYCLGANLARAEMEEALAILPRRMPDLRLAGEPQWRTGTGITGPTVLPLAFTPT